MSSTREKAIEAVLYASGNHAMKRETPVPEAICESYGEDVFNESVMKTMLPAQVYEKLLNTLHNGAPLDPAIADDVANAMKHWAISKGATHYTHWFQPLTGATAEKHDAFLEPNASGEAILKFSGKNLIAGESDASSFPSGGLRSTFEARGYTAWDPTSPAFLRRGRNTITLCIPTAFWSYTGEALDKKTPLLRSIQAVEKAVRHLMKALHQEKPDARVSVSLGAEQEYFLIDRHFYYARPDLVQCGRTLFGAPPPRHQQLEDHYYGTIKPRILAFMADVDRQLWSLGIPAKTRHNEVAPAQFEIAPLFEELNLAVDHNMILMDVLKQTAEEHQLICLLHEKPFAGINGSGKHNNWSVEYGKLRLFKPVMDDPVKNEIFLASLCSVIQAVDRHADLLRAATAFAGNDYRLGANEAPPAIISIFLGEQLDEMLEQLESNQIQPARKRDTLSAGVSALPSLFKDAADRNRTSPFAFTGNKFEFRSPGSSQSCAGINIMLNTIFAESLEETASAIDRLPEENFHEGIRAVFRDIIRKHKRIIFNGNGYDSSWVQEAARRGLPNYRSTLDTIGILTQKKNMELFEKTGVFSRTELLSRQEIQLEDYQRKIQIEAELSLLIARTIIQPVLIREFKDLAGCGSEIPPAIARIRSMLSEGIQKISDKADSLEKIISIHDYASYTAAMNELRIEVDAMEKIAADDLWPLPKYREMLFLY